MNEARRIIADMIALAELKDRRPAPPPPASEVNTILVEKFAEIQRQTLDAFTRLSTRQDAPRIARTPSTDEMPDALILAYLEGEEVNRDGDEWAIGGRLYCFSESDDSWESFDADDWVKMPDGRWRHLGTGRVVGKTRASHVDLFAEAFDEAWEAFATSADRKPGDVWQGQSGRWFTKKDNGRVVPAKNPGAAEKSSTKTDKGDSGGAGEKPTKTEKPTPADPQELLAGIKDLQANPDKINEQSIKDAVSKMMTLKQQDINAIKKELGLKAGGTKEKQVRALMDKILGSGEKAEAPQKTPEAERLGKMEAAFKGLGVELTDDLLADPEKLKGALRAALGGEKEPAKFDPAKAEQDAFQHMRDIKSENQRTGGIINVPELVDRMMASSPGMTQADAHKLLQQWQKEDKLTLQLDNDPRLNPRAKDTIDSPRGRLAFVMPRPDAPESKPPTPPKPPEKTATNTVASTWKVKPGEDFGAFANRISGGRAMTGEQMQKVRQEFDKQQGGATTSESKPPTTPDKKPSETKPKTIVNPDAPAGLEDHPMGGTKEAALKWVQELTGGRPMPTIQNFNPLNLGGKDKDDWPTEYDSRGTAARAVKAVADAVKKNSLNKPDIKSLYESVKREQPDLTLRQFQSALVQAQRNGLVRLWGYTLPLPTNKDLAYSLPLDKEMKHYVGPGGDTNSPAGKEAQEAKVNDFISKHLNSGEGRSVTPDKKPSETKPKAGKVDQATVDKVRDSVLESLRSTAEKYDNIRRLAGESEARVSREKRKYTPEEVEAGNRRRDQGFAIQEAHREALHAAADQVEQMSKEQAMTILEAFGDEGPNPQSPAWRSAKKAAEWLRRRGETALVAAGDTLV